MKNSRTGYTIEIIKPHKNSSINYHVKRYYNGHVAFDMEKNGKMAYGRFIQITREKLNTLLANDVKMEEAKLKGLGFLEMLEEVYG